MDKINIEGVILTPLKKIQHPLGDIFLGIKNSDSGFTGFGEAYFSTIKKGKIKGWNRHQKMTLNLLVPMGEVTFVIFDDRQKNNSNGEFFKIKLSPTNYQRLTIPPGLWIAFKGNEEKINFILNVASIEHDPNEIDRRDLDSVNFNWKSV